MINDHHTKLKGDIAVATTYLNLIKKGYIVSLPATEHAPYDLICDIGSKILRIQVKCRATGDIPKFNNWSDKNGNHKIKIDPTKFDYFALVNGDYSIVCYPLSSMVGNKMNYTIPNTFHLYHWYENYLDFKETVQPKVKNNNVDRSNYAPNWISKIEWPNKERLHELVYEMPVTKLASILGVSDSAIYKKCKYYGISKPPRGYWAKIYASENNEIK